MVFGLVMLVPLAGYYLHLARRGLRAVTRIIRLETRPVTELEEGPVELAGTIRALERPIRGPSGHRCVYAEVKVDGYTHGGKNREVIHSETEERVVPAELVDASGAKVRVDFENVEVLGEHTMISGNRGVLRQATKSWTKKVAPRAQYIEINETRVTQDAKVVLTGRATVVDAKVEMGEGGYRDGAPTEKRTFLVSGTEDEPLLVTEGTEAKLLWKATWPVALLVACATIALTFAGVLIAVIIA